jgi:peptide/nickel transport system substrate-binding protein
VKAIGTGPFAVAEFDPSRRLALKRNLAYWGAQKPLLDEIVFQAIPDESSVVAGLRTGQVAMAEFSSALNYQVARGIATLDTVQAPSTRWVVLDLAGDQEPTSRLEVRQAIALAIDRAAILQIAGSGLGQRLGVLPPGMKGWALPWQELPNQQRDVAKAKALLRTAGFAGRVPMKIRNIVGFPALAAALPAPSWGAILNEGKEFLALAPWVSLFPGGAIVLAVLAFNIIGDGLRDALDPRAEVR